MDSFMLRCTTSLDHFACLTDTELIKIVSGINKTTFLQDYKCLMYFRSYLLFNKL